jgi:RNA polymerase sigma-B factor
LRKELVTHYDKLALALARRFPSRRESREDLAQVARLGLIQAVDRFDPKRNRPFVAFARATILGELKHHVRDHTWGMRVPRTLQERYLQVAHSVDDLTQELGRSPRIPEVAARVGLNDEQVLEAIDVDLADRILSLDRPNGDGRHLDPWKEDRDFERVEARIELATLVRNLPERTQRVLELRFVDELTQSEIARHIGENQMCVSRTLARALARMRVTSGSRGPEGAGQIREAGRDVAAW